MFGEFLRRLTDPAPFPDADARLALTALLVRIAKADNDFSPSERSQINEIITTRYGLSDVERDALLASAEMLEREAPDTVRFTRAIKDAVPYEDRRAVLGSMWSVVLADGSRANEEDALMRLVANLLGVTDQDSALARQKLRDMP